MRGETLAGRLLLVDDDPAIGRFIKRVAEGLGFTLTSTTDPGDFLKSARTWYPTLIIMDLQMPGTDGVQLLRELAADQCTAPVILASGFDLRVLRTAQELGATRGLKMAGILEKPIDVDSLRELLTPFKAVSPDELSADLDHAIADDHLFLEYQPKLDLRHWRIAGVEALVRWRHPTRGIIQPDQFITLAEQTGLIHRLTDWVVLAALKQAASWHIEGLVLDIAVNISAQDLIQRDLPERLERYCRAAGVDPATMVLEITETGAMGQAVQMLDVLTRLRLKGFKLSLDDFGTGYSSLMQLQKMPFSEIKIDRGFVGSLPIDRGCRVIAKIIIDLARNLELESVAEGVEHDSALNWLAEIGCDIAQGYHLSRPVTADLVPEITRQDFVLPVR
jgi:EAL domain-containing protein (putative c-di-GMP-specific phosphodiesterase class I)